MNETSQVKASMNATQTVTSGTGHTLPRAPIAQQRARTSAVSAPLSADVPCAPQAAAALQAGKTPRSSRTWRRLLTVLGVPAVLALGYAGVRFWLHARAWEETDNAYIAAHIHTVSTRVAGTIKEVLVEENQEVAAGAVLARLDPGDFEVRKQQALARLAEAQAQERQAAAQISQARAQVVREQARATRGRQDLERAQSLYQGGSGAVSKQEFDQAQAEAEAAQAGFQGAQAALEGALTLSEAARAQTQAAQANLRDAELQLSYTEIVAPAAGRVGKKNLETGNRVQPGQGLLALVQPDVWVTANFKETQLARMASGQVATLRLDAFPGRTFNGVVESVSPASGAQFALLPPDNATGNFTRIVQRVPVKIRFNAASLAAYAGRVVAGMSAVVEVKVGE